MTKMAKLAMKNEEIFDVLLEAHRETIHGARQAMEKKLRETYANVSRDSAVAFNNL